MSVLYRKYRPQVFGDIAGQEHVKRTLIEEVASGRLAHSYLFTGPRGVGKTTTARILAKAVNCRARKKNSGEPCDACASCEQISEGHSLDVIEIDAASHTGVDNVREQIIEASRFSPTDAPYKVFIIDEVHMLSSSAFNALLKTLEEPPAHVIFVLATTELHKLPATVVSRCQRFEFRKIQREDIIERLKGLVKAEKVKVDDDVLIAVARRSEGCLRDAESLLTQILSMGDTHVTMDSVAIVLPSLSSDRVAELAVAVLERDIPSAFGLWERVGEDGSDPHRVIVDMIDLLRSLALVTLKRDASPVTFPLSDERRAELMKLAVTMTAGDYAELLESLMRVREDMKRVELVELPFEMMVMAWGGPATDRSMQYVSSRERRVKGASGASREKSSTKNGESEDTDTMKPENEISAGEVGGKTSGNNADTVESESVTEKKDQNSATDDALLDGIRSRWQEILTKSQEKNPGLPYMLGVGELVGVEKSKLKIGFQYVLYRDRLNGKCKRMFEEVLSEVMGTKVLVEAVLVKKTNDDSHEATKKLPEGFAELVNDFGGSIA